MKAFLFIVFVTFVFVHFVMGCGTIKVPATTIETTTGTSVGTATATGSSTQTATQTDTSTSTETTVQTPTVTNNVTVIINNQVEPVTYSTYGLQNLTTQCVDNVMSSIQPGELLSELQPDAQMLLNDPAVCQMGQPYLGAAYQDPLTGESVVQVYRPRVCWLWKRVGQQYDYSYQVKILDTLDGQVVLDSTVEGVDQ